jgi:hypothetical protein
VTCPSCGLALPTEARFCARCGASLRPARVEQPATAPVWLLAVLWVGAGGTFWIAAFYGIFALGVVPPAAVGAGPDAGSLRGAAALIAACAASLSAAHAAAAVGLMTARPWARTFTTMVCVVWGLSCVGLPVGLLGINALWRARRDNRVGTLAR